MGVLPPPSEQVQRQPKSKVLRDKAKKAFKGLADSYLDDAHATSMTKGPSVSVNVLKHLGKTDK
jgi:hypothetical protein